MTALMQEPTAKDDRRGILARLVPEFWGSVAIAFMWLTVLFVGVFGGNMVFSTPPQLTTIPSAVVVAVFAAIGTSSVAKRVFGRRGRD